MMAKNIIRKKQKKSILSYAHRFASTYGAANNILLLYMGARCSNGEMQNFTD